MSTPEVLQLAEPFLASVDDLVAVATGELRPPRRQWLDEWADEKFYLSADAGAAEPGRWTTYPFQRGWMRAMSDPSIEHVTVMKSARVGYTESIKALVGYHVDYDACPIMLIQPSENDAKGFAKENIGPMLRDCPAVGEKFSARSRDSMLLRRFRGGVLDIVGARAPGNFRRKGRRLVIGDEVDGYPLDNGEGDPLALAWKRAEAFWNRKLIDGSSPKDHGTSRIEKEFFAGDQRRRYVPCPHCREMQVLQFKNLHWPDGQPELAVFVCIHCGCEIEHEHKLWMDEHGEDRPGPHAQFPDDPAPAPFHGHASFHIWSAYSRLPNATWGHIAAAFVKANSEGVEALKSFVNTWLGETWKSRGEAPDWQRLYDRREHYPIGTCPDGVRFLTAAVDVQRSPGRLVWEVVGWGRGKESWSIDQGEVPGDTSDLTDNGPWPAIDALLDRSFEHASGALLRIRMLAVDTSDQTQTCYQWVRAKDSGRVMAIKGNDSASILVSKPSKVDVLVSGVPFGNLLLWRVGGPLAKSELYGWLRLNRPTDEAQANGVGYPPGYCHFPEYGEEFFKQLTGEQLVSKRTKQGYTVHVWEQVPGRQNHSLDVRVYARAAAAVVGLDNWKESDWLTIERLLVGMVKQAAASPPVPAVIDIEPHVSAPTPAPPSPPPPAPPPQRTRRIARSAYIRR